MGVKQAVLVPAVMRASIIAYDEAVKVMLGGKGDGQELPDEMRNALASAIIDFAEQGIADPHELRDAALARVRI